MRPTFLEAANDSRSDRTREKVTKRIMRCVAVNHAVYNMLEQTAKRIRLDASAFYLYFHSAQSHAALASTINDTICTKRIAMCTYVVDMMIFLNTLCAAAPPPA